MNKENNQGHHFVILNLENKADFTLYLVRKKKLIFRSRGKAFEKLENIF